MNEYFYYVGFLYLLDIIRNLWVAHKPVDSEKTLHINSNMDAMELMDVAQHYQSKNKINFLKHITGTVFFIWAIIGYKSQCDEQYWFLSVVILTIVTWSFIFLIGIYFVFNSFFKNKAEIPNVGNNPKYYIPFSEIASSIELVLISIILYLHFFIN